MIEVSKNQFSAQTVKEQKHLQSRSDAKIAQRKTFCAFFAALPEI